MKRTQHVHLHDDVEDQVLLFELEDHVSVCSSCASRVTVPYETGPDWCCSLPCYRLHSASRR